MSEMQSKRSYSDLTGVNYSPLRWARRAVIHRSHPPTRAWFHTSDTTIASISKKVNVSGGQRSVDAIRLAYIFTTTSISTLSVTDFDPKGTISEVRVHAGPHSDILDAGRSPNAVREHAETAQVDFEVDRPPPADSPTGDLLITMVQETVILY